MQKNLTHLSISLAELKFNIIMKHQKEKENKD